MLKLKLYIFFIFFFLLTGSILFIYIPFGSFEWIKIVLFILLLSAAYLLVVRKLNIKEKKNRLELEYLQEQLQEKRIKLKEESGHTAVIIPERDMEMKEVLDAVYENLSERVESLRIADSSKTGLISHCRNFVTTYADTQNSRQKEIKSIESNYTTIVQNTNKAFTIADNLSSSAKNAFDLSGEVQEGIKAVTAVLQEAAEKSNKLFEQSKKISKIIEIISEISAKTHILSINASIVSARAGKEGKAFEVVSKEIRKLATETDKSLKAIEEEILSIQEIIRSVVKGINDANKQTIAERDMLTAVIGALQGVTLGVEVLRAVSNVVNNKTIQQKQLTEDFIASYQKIMVDIGQMTPVSELKQDAWDMSEQLNQLRSRIDYLFPKPRH